MKHRHRQSGYALLLVIGTLALVGLLILATQGSVEGTFNQTRICEARQNETEAVAATITLIMASSVGPTSQALTIKAPNGLRAQVSRSALSATHPLWTRLPALRPQPGDELVKIKWLGMIGSPMPDRYIINRQGLRQGVINLGSPERAVKAE